ncbi:Early nodulin-like protein 2 [Zea mays]|uniref:Early nodulin-like protein 2 n=1 Tax=Zea mays TaxID=4577 RepID=A0A3L6GA80_MAIZE|nr:Early nodulin-like protein 2 [Zea mays]
MFLADKYRSLLPSSHQQPHSKPTRRRQQQQQLLQQKGEADRFGAALAARLGSLLPLPASPLAALARVADLLALTLADAGPALAAADPAVAAHLDAGVALLDACNAISAGLDRLRRRLLLARLALHLVLSPSTSGGRARARARACAALADRGDHPAPSPLPSLPFEQPRGRVSAAARVLAAVDAISSLAAAAAAAVLVGGPVTFPRVSGGVGDLPWAEPFNAVSGQLAALGDGEVASLDEAVRRLASALDAASGEGAADDEVAVRAAALEAERRAEEVAPLLDHLSDAVGGVFRAALGLRNRNAEVDSFMVGPADFKYSEDSVLVVTEADYDSCRASHPVFFSNNGDTEVTLDRPGPVYFISGETGHCERGQRMVVRVAGQGAPPPAPPSPPAPTGGTAAPGTTSGAIAALAMALLAIAIGV